MIDDLIEQVNALSARVKDLERKEYLTWTFLTNSVQSESWNGDGYSTTAATLIDLSAVFGVPAKVKAIAVKIAGAESAAHPLTANYFGIGPSAAFAFAVLVYPVGSGNIANNSGICPCNADGDVYYVVNASGSGTMACYIDIFGYCI